MATSETKENTCLVCLEAPALRKVDTCEHSYCENCLSPPNFACPQCVTEGGKRQEMDRTVVGEKEAQLSGNSATDQTKAPLVVANCRLCHFRGTTVTAVNICKVCKSIPLCVKCSQDHRKNKTTQRHVVTVLVAKKKGEVHCEAHGETLEYFCTTCSANVCHVCVLLDHGDHVVKTFNDVVNTEMEEVRIALENEEKWLDILKSDEKELQESKATAQEMEDVLIKSIEDHAEKCIEEILKHKAELKKQVKCNFEVVRTMEKRLAAMPELLSVSRDVAAAANQLLNEQAELHSTYVEKLIGLKQQLHKLEDDHIAYQDDMDIHQYQIKDLCEAAITFYPRTPNCKIGGFREMYYAGPTCDAGGPCVCKTCERKADATRVVECRKKGTCTCGTCGCVFDRTKLTSGGKCAENHTCRKRIICKDCRIGQRCTRRDWMCKNRITVSNFIP